MKMARRDFLASGAGLVLAESARAQAWSFTGGILYGTWQAPAMSADGTKIYVPTFPDSIFGSPPGYYHTSSNTGSTWTKQTGSGNRFWVFGCCSSDGSIAYGCDQGSGSGGLIYKSTNYGVTWNATNFPALAWQQVVCSSDGTKVAACVGSQVTQADIYTSVDGGTTVVDQTGSLARDYLSITMSGDGTKIATANWLGKGVNGDGKIYVSTNWQSGSPAWTGSNAAANGATFAVVSYSRDGSTLYAAFNGNGSTSHVFISTNDGGSWTDVNPSGGTAAQRNWATMACNANGQTVVVASATNLCVSSNAGSTWSQQPLATNNPSTQANAFPAVSDNGQIIVNAVYAGFINISKNGGSSWTITSATP
jgi:hypothetical protein